MPEPSGDELISVRYEIVTGPGGRQILVDDPSGNPIELFQPAEGGPGPAR